jgi:U3 small nucleolar RNA-associated protein 7
MIALDPDFIGSIAPLPKLTEVGEDGRTTVPYSQLPRYERLRISGKADEFEYADDDVSNDEGEDDGEGSKKTTKLEKEKKKMRGKKKSLKRFVILHSHEHI